MVKIYLIVENKAIDGFEFEHGLSIGVEADGKSILFDVGASDIFLRNAEKIGFNIENVDVIVLSHAHYDHTNGLAYIKNKSIVTHPNSLAKTYRKRDHNYIGIPLKEDECKERFDMKLSKTPMNISDKIIYLGEIPRLTSFESKETPFLTEYEKDDFVLSDSAIVIKTEQGNILITGCSHSGIINVIKYAKKITGESKFKAIIGGFHLLSVDDVAKKTIQELQKENIENLYPMHCTADEVIEYMMTKLDNIVRIKAGNTIAINNY